MKIKVQAERVEICGERSTRGVGVRSESWSLRMERFKHESKICKVTIEA